jgi:hypothetical protein
LLQKSADGQWYYIFGNGVDRVVYVVNGSDAIYGAWTHLAVTYDGGTYTGYLNGTFDVSAQTPIKPNNVAPLRIGFDQNADGWKDYWNGDIDEVAFYQKALTPDQIAAHYAAALYGVNSSPVFKKQPESKRVVDGGSVVFAPVVEGSVPLQLQWMHNGVPVPGETNSILVLTSLSMANSGLYQLTATNQVGSAKSDSATLAVLPPPQFANLTNNLVLHLTFDRKYTDSSGRGNDGKAVGTTAFVAGTIGSGALHVSTTVDSSNPNNPVVKNAAYVTLGSPADLNFSSNVNFSVSYWVRFSGTPGDLPFFCNAQNSFTNPGFTFAPSYQAGGWSWSLGDVATSSYVGIYGQGNSINDGLWHNLVHTFDRKGSGFTYLDGAAVDSRSIVPPTDLNSGNPVNIGQDGTGQYPEAADIDVDDLAVWHRVLDPFEAYSIYAVGLNGKSFDTYGPVSLAVSSDSGGINIVWQAGTLLETDQLGGTWSAVPGAAAPFYRVTPTGTQKFYRVQL